MSIDIAIKYGRSPAGRVYFYQHWIPASPAALVVFIHGLGDHSGRYEAFINGMVSSGFAMAAYDQLGHGRSQGKRGHVGRFSDWVEDLGSFVNFSLAKVPRGTPLFLVGSGLGSLVGVDYLLTHEQDVAGMVSISGAFLPIVRLPRWKARVAERLRGVFPRLTIDSGIMRECMTGDADEYERLSRDVLFHDRISLCARHEIASRLQLLGGMPARIHEPMLIVAGTDDRLYDPGGSRWFAERLTSAERQWKAYEGARHDLLHDVCREAVLSDIAGWIHRHRVGAKAPGEQYPLKRGEEIWQNVS